MLTTLYTFAFFASLLYLILTITFFHRRLSVFYIILFSSILVSNLGYMQLANAQSEQMAIFSNQVVYLGECFIPLLMLICFGDLCKVVIKRRYITLFVIFATFTFILVSTIGRVPWYYKEISLIKEHGISIMQKNYGALHTFYPLYMISTNIAGVVILIKSFCKQKDVSYITQFLLVFAMMISVSTYIIERTTSLQIPLIPFGQVISETIVFFLLVKISLYDITKISSTFIEKSKTAGFFIFDWRKKYMGCDEAAKEWFPELQLQKLDHRIKNPDTELLVQALAWIDGKETDKSVIFEKDGKFFEAKYSILHAGKKRKIHCIYLRDDTQQQQYTKIVEDEVNQKTQKLRQIQDDIIISMASIVENRDNNTGGHIARTSDIVKIFVNHLIEKKFSEALTEKFADCVIKAAPLHDFGKIAVPDMILNKPGKFTDEEYEIMKTHSAKGAVIVKQILANADDPEFKNIAVNVAHYHHEKWNGSGYPCRIKEKEIPFEARIMALADVFDALVSKRVYKESFDYDRAFGIIADSCGSHFDPQLCQEFIECRPQLENLYNSYND